MTLEINPSNRILASRGFTLLEITMALSLLSFIAILGYSTVFSLVESKKVLDDQRDARFIANAVLSRLTRELQSAFSGVPLLPSRDSVNLANAQPQQSINLIGKEETLPNGEPGANIRFVALEAGQYLPDGGTHSGLVQIEYRVAEDPDDPTRQRYILVRDETPVTRPFDKAYAKTMTFPITKELISFRLRYYDPGDEQWVTEWGSEGRVKLPGAIEFSVTLRSQAGVLSRFVSAVPLRTIY
jgi:prepilin-type N-terminal cleavage/methylation domain-containing protein